MSLAKCRQSPPCEFLHDPNAACPVVTIKNAPASKLAPAPPEKIERDPTQKILTENTSVNLEPEDSPAIAGHRAYMKEYMRAWRARKKDEEK